MWPLVAATDDGSETPLNVANKRATSNGMRANKRMFFMDRDATETDIPMVSSSFLWKWTPPIDDVEHFLYNVSKLSASIPPKSSKAGGTRAQMPSDVRRLSNPVMNAFSVWAAMALSEDAVFTKDW